MKIERRGQLNLPIIDDDGIVTFHPSLSEFNLLGRKLQHIGADDTENRVVVGSSAKTEVWNVLF